MSFRQLFAHLHQCCVLPIGFTLIIAMLIFTSLFAVSQMKQSSSLMTDTVKQHSVNTKLLRSMSQAATSRTVHLMQMIQETDPFKVDELFLEHNKAATTFTIARIQFAEQNQDPVLRQLLKQQGNISRLNAPLQNKIVDLIQEGKKNAAVTLFTQKNLPNQKSFFNIIKKMEEYQFSKANFAFEKIKQNNEQDLATILIIDAISIFISIFLTTSILIKQKKNNSKLTTLANTDNLTKLANRDKLIKELDRTFADQVFNPSEQNLFAIIFIDIDYFKSINDNYGHEVGDEVIKYFSKTILSMTSKEDLLSRFGGDEFVLLLRNIETENDAITFINRLSYTLDTSFIINHNEIFTTSSIGMCLSTDANDTTTLLKHADIAMYSAKESGRNCYRLYSKETQERIEKDHNISHALHSILKNNNKSKQLFLKYQPLVNIENGDSTECEALIRWKNSQGEIISPDDFITLAEKTNLIEKINIFVIDEVCKQQLAWKKDGTKDIRISINLSGNKLIFNKLLDHFNKNMIKYDLKPKQFGIEITERTLFEISKETVKTLDDFRQQGMKISVDDFGTGYSSLSYLKNLPVTTLKIDKAFINDLANDKADQSLVKAIITLGHSLDLDIVAEGVETEEQLAFLKKNACNIAQGYYFHRPLESTKIPHLKLVA